MLKGYLKNTAIYGIGNVAQKGLSFLLVFLYTHFLTAEEIGMINTLQVFSAIYILFLSFGLERSLYRLYHDYKEEEDKKNFLGTVNISIVLISILIIAITVIFRAPVSRMFDKIPFYPLIALSMIDAFFTALIIVPKLLFQVSGKPMKFIMITIGQGLTSVLCIVAALWMGYRSAAGILTAGILSYLLFLPVIVVVMIRNMNFRLDLRILWNTLKYSLPLVPSLLSSWVINMSDRLFLESFYSMKEVGLYSVAYKIGQVVQLFSTAVLMAYNPLFFSLANQPDPDKKKIIGLQNNNIRGVLFLCFIVALLSNDFITICLTEQYASVAHIVPVVITGYFFIQMISMQNLSFHQTKRTGVLMLISCTAAAINIILNYFFIRKFGMNGAAWATMLTQLIFFIITYYVSTKAYFLRIEFKKLVPLFLGLAMMIFIAFHYFQPGWAGLILKLFLVISGILVFNFSKLKKRAVKYT